MKVLHDVFPARVRVVPADAVPAAEELGALTVFWREAGRMVDRVRVVVTEKTVMVAADSSSGPVLIFQERYRPESVAWSRSRKDTHRLVTESGKLLLVAHDASCGCGSKLRAWNPYRTVYSTKDPVE